MKINLWPFWQSRKIVYTDLLWIRWKSRTNWQRNGEGDSNSRKKNEERKSVWPLSSYQKIKRGKNVHLFRDWYSKPNQVESLTKTNSESICKTFVDTKRIYLNLTNVAQQEKKTWHFGGCNCESKHEMKVYRASKQAGKRKKEWELHDTTQAIQRKQT